MLLRVSDYLEDNEEMPPKVKARLLEGWASTLEGAQSLAAFLDDLPPVTASTPDAEVARQTRAVFEAYAGLPEASREVLRQHVADTSRGMARWSLRGPDFAHEADLDDYMHEVAGRVGLLLTDLFALRSPAIERHHTEMSVSGREFGLGLQTVNVIRGLHEDRHRGWVFVPRTFLPAGTDSPAGIFHDGNDDLALEVLEHFTDKAARHLDAALGYVERIPRSMRGVRIFCALPLFFALRTLGVSRGNPAVFKAEVKMSRPEVVALTTRCELLWWSNTWLRRTARRLSAG